MGVPISKKGKERKSSSHACNRKKKQQSGVTGSSSGVIHACLVDVQGSKTFFRKSTILDVGNSSSAKTI